MTTLYIFGDSFTVPPEQIVGDSQGGLWASPGDTWSSGKPKPKTQTWINRTAGHLSTLHENLDVINYSQYGVAQDFCWYHLLNAMDKIQPDDYVIVAVTHPNRFWYIQDQPNLSNHHILNFQKYITEDQALAVQLFMQYIQRPELDTLHQIYRMKTLAYEVVKRGLRRPLMLNCFFSDISAVDQIPELMWARGNLFNVQAQEYSSGEDETTEYFEGIDCRYNHMCMSNHEIMAAKVIAAFTQDQPVDLDQGFHTDLLKKDSLQDEAFCRQELDWDKLQLVRSQKKTEKPKWSVLK